MKEYDLSLLPVDNFKEYCLRLFSILLKILLGVFSLVVLLLIFVSTPRGQDIVKTKAVEYLSSKTHSGVALDKIYVNWRGNIRLSGLYLEDLNRDTLLYVGQLELSLPLLPVIFQNKIRINYFSWERGVVGISRRSEEDYFNYQFLADAFASPDTDRDNPDTSSAAMDIELGRLQLSDIRFSYLDQPAGMDARGRIGQLEVRMNGLDPDSLFFDLEKGLLTESDFEYRQTSAPPAAESDESGILPRIRLGELRLENVAALYISDPDEISAEISMGHFFTEAPEIDLAGQTVRIRKILLASSSAAVTVPENAAPVTEPEISVTVPETETVVTWPDWDIRLDALTLDDNKITYLAGIPSAGPMSFDPNHIRLTGLSLEARDVYLKEETAGFLVENFAVREESGPTIERIHFQAEVTDRHFGVTDLVFESGESQIKADVLAEYSSLADALAGRPDTRIEADLRDLQFEAGEWLDFLPETGMESSLAVLAEKRISAKGNISGNLQKLRVQDLTLNWGSQTRFFAAGTMENPTDPDRLTVDFPRLLIRSTGADLGRWIDEEESGVRLPEEVLLTTELRGSAKDLDATAILRTSFGTAEVSGNYYSDGQPGYRFRGRLDEIRLDSLLITDQLGLVSMTFEGAGEGTEVSELTGSFEAEISELETAFHTLKNWKISGDIDGGRGKVYSEYEEDALRAALQAFIDLDSVSSFVAFDLQLKEADLHALGVMEEPVTIAFDVKGKFDGIPDRLLGEADLTGGKVRFKDRGYQADPMHLRILQEADTSSVDFDGGFLVLSLQSNAALADMGSSLSRHLQSYMTDTVSTADSLYTDTRMKMEAELRSDPILQEVFLPDLEEMDPLKIRMNFDAGADKISADLDLPYLRYAGLSVDSLYFHGSSDAEKADVAAGMERLDFGSFSIHRTRMDGSLRDGDFLLSLEAKHEEEDLAKMGMTGRYTNDTLTLRLDPENLVLYFKEWDISPSNQILYADSTISIRDFRLAHDDQYLSLESAADPDRLFIEFGHFELGNIVSYFNPDTLLADGLIDGNAEIKDPFGAPEIKADMEVNEFEVYGMNFGALKIKGTSPEPETYGFEVALAGGEAELHAAGRYTGGEEAALSADLEITKINMTLAESFSGGQLKDTEGFLSGNMKINGPATDPDYEGELTFSGVRLTPSELDAPFSISGETISFDRTGLLFREFKIRDDRENVFSIDGKVNTENPLNPVFDLQLRAEDFQVLHSGPGDNDLFYGDAVFDVSATVGGDLHLPKVRMDLKVGEKTNLTYIMPQGQAEIEEREGVVTFVNKKDPEDILSDEREQEEPEWITGYDINAVVSMRKEAVFRVIISEDTGDHFEVSGEGELNFAILPNGQTTLTGMVELNKGHYEMNLYNMVMRRFDIVEGSRISWSGDMMDAALDVSALYRVETAASGLMASQTSGSDQSVKNQYRRRTPFEVYLNVDGMLNSPQLNFSLDMPEDARGAGGGQVYSRIQQLNEDEQELNKQVFSLLVLGQFYPGGGNDGSSGGIAHVARNNLNQLLADQLNLFSDRLFGDLGVELDFDLDSYTDYQGEDARQRTMLDVAAQKKFLDERLIIKVGSEVELEGTQEAGRDENPLIGSVSVEYLLTPNGNFRIRGFRKNVYENVIDGQTIVNGIALIFSREFNKFDQLWNSILLKEDRTQKKNENED